MDSRSSLGEGIRARFAADMNLYRLTGAAVDVRDRPVARSLDDPDAFKSIGKFSDSSRRLIQLQNYRENSGVINELSFY